VFVNKCRWYCCR